MHVRRARKLGGRGSERACHAAARACYCERLRGEWKKEIWAWWVLCGGESGCDMCSVRTVGCSLWLPGGCGRDSMCEAEVRGPAVVLVVKA